MATKPLFFLLSLLFTITISISTPLQYQTLTPTPLPSPHPLSFPEFESESESESVSVSVSVSESEPKPELSLNLHHIDNLSPTSSPLSLFHLRLRRDAARATSLISAAAAGRRRNSSAGGGRFSSSIVSGLAEGSGEYFTRIGIGSPPRSAYMVLDTGSDVVWAQCAPCRKCYSQTDPIFDPAKSSSFRRLPCASPICRRLDSPGCSRRRSCLYQVSYGDGSFTTGEFSTETLTFGKTKVPNVAFGCGHDNEGLFVGAAGLLGLGRGKLSFPSQSGNRFGKKFSYCLVDRSASSNPSSMIFGDSAAANAVYTPLIANPKLDTFYYVGLAGISVGGRRVAAITAATFRIDGIGGGGVIVDSGTSVTRLTRPAYVALRDAFLAGARGLRRAAEFSLFDTCFDLSGESEVKVPTVVMHFDGGADVSLPASNYLIPVDSDGKFCFAFAGTGGGLSIIGNIQQQSFRVVFDLAGNRVGFAPRGCA